MRVAVVQWGRTGAGPLFAQELAQALQEDGCDVVVSYSLDAEVAERFVALGVPSFTIRTYRDKRGAVLGLPRLLWAALRLDRFLAKKALQVARRRRRMPGEMVVDVHKRLPSLLGVRP